MNFAENPKQSYTNLSNCIRVLAADSVEKARSGHPGMPLGMADVMTVLAFEFLKFNPEDPKWFNRDRLILSNGHGCLLLYVFYYLTGYKDFTLDDLKNFRQLGSKTPGHPEYAIYDAIETTTGPLGQGLASSVGMAIAAKKYQHHLGRAISDHKIYCMVGDGCLMEGISYEASSLAGHLKLNNLIILFDDNQISIDGKTELSTSEDHLARFQALGWNSEQVDGHDFHEIAGALRRAQNSDKPYFIAFRTLIAKGTNKKAGCETSHGAPLGHEEITHLKEAIGFKNEPFWVPKEGLQSWRALGAERRREQLAWQKLFDNLSEEQKNYAGLCPVIDVEFLNTVALSDKSEATRVSSGHVLQSLMKHCDKIICGSADLAISNNIKHPESRAISRDDFSGNFIHYGVREHAMAGVMNGLALSGFLPIGGTFLVFSDYMKPSIRIAALMHKQVIYVMTHDSIGVGEDGPTHQPIEQLASLRAMPNLLVLRPADRAETIECWKIALEHTTGPSMLVLSRQNIPQLRSDPRQNLSTKGAYVIDGNLSDAKICIFASGSEVALAIQVAKKLEAKWRTCVISLPSFELFFQQPAQYINELLGGDKIKIGIEAASSFGWHKIIGDKGLFFGIDRFGASAPAAEVYKHFGLTADNIVYMIENSGILNS